jgi:hypothetical protein
MARKKRREWDKRGDSGRQEVEDGKKEKKEEGGDATLR